MSVRAMTWVWDQHIPPNAKLVLLAIADHAHDDGTNAWPSMRRLSMMTGYSKRNIQRIIHEAVRHGLITIEERGTGNRSTRYALNLESPLPLGLDDWTTQGATPEIRRELISRFQRRCYFCKEPGDAEHGPDDQPWVAHRLIPGHAGGSFQAINLALACDSCHQTGGEDILSPPDNLTPRGRQDDTPGATDDAQGEDTHDTQTVIEPSEEPHENLPLAEIPERIIDQTTGQRTNPGWDALEDIFGYRPEGSEASLWGKMAAWANTEPDPRAAVLDRAQRLIGQWGAKALTPTSLHKWWQRFGTPLGAATEGDAAKIRAAMERQKRRAAAARMEDETEPPLALEGS